MTSSLAERDCCDISRVVWVVMGSAGTRLPLRRIVDVPDVSCESSLTLHAADGVSTPPPDGVVDELTGASAD